MRSKAAVMLSVVMGLLAVLMMWVYNSSQRRQLLQLAEPRDVLVATADILANTVVDESMVQRIQVPATYQQPKALTDVREVVGRVVAVPVPRGAQILGTYIEDGGRTALAYEVPRGRRAITIAVSDITGVGGLIRPANFVDILGTFEYGRPTGSSGGQTTYADEKTETRTLMQNVLVIAVGQEHRGERPEAMTAEDAGSLAEQAQRQAALQRANRDVRNVTVLVSPPQVQELVLAQEIGTLTLALRSNLDAGQVLDLKALDPLGLLQVPIPPKPRAAPIWREIRGTPALF
jgi:pilus assembly protein CpaB